MNKFISVCGIDCEKCQARIATVNNDNELRKKVAEDWTKLNGVQINLEDINCEGCRMDGVKTPFCSGMCEIRKCAVSKNLETCGNCQKLMDCNEINMIICNNKEALENLKKYGGKTE